jgi:eukaryotic-like serine/threonine-protein kinase
MVGTPEYMAPEQAVGNAVGPYTDLYAAGLIAYEMLTRRLPFEGATPMALVIQHVQKEPPPPSSFVEVHPALDALVLQMLAKEPSQRPASAEEARRELRRILQQISQGEQLAPLSSTSSLPRADGDGGAATVVRATPSVPMSGPMVSASVPKAPAPAPMAPVSASRASMAAPVSSLRSQVDNAFTGADEGSADVKLEKGSQPNRRGLIIGVAAAAAVVMAALGGWMMRGAASEGGALPPAPVPVAPVAAQAPASPPPVAPVPTEIKEPQDTAATPPEPQPGDSVESTASTSRKAGPEMGVLLLKVRGTGSIKVDGKYKGEVPPLNTLTLPAGEHKLEVINPRAYPYSAKITITAGKRVTHRVKLKPKGTSETP